MRIEPAGRIAGELTPPADKSISHRAALMCGMCEDEVRIRNYLRSEDTASTLSAVGQLGAEVREDGADVVVRGVGLRGPRETSDTIDVGNAGTLLRLLPGWLAGQGRGSWTLDGDESIRRRPVDRIAEPLRLMGADVECRDGRLPPLTINGAGLGAVRYELPVASAQVKSCVLLAGLLATGATTVIERLPSRDHTEVMLRAAGAPVEVDEDDGATAITVETVDRLALDEVNVPGDFSSAAFFVVAATLAPEAELVLRGVGVNPTRTGLLDVLERMGAKVELRDLRTVGGEAVADVAVGNSPLRSTTVEAGEVPLLIDELPLVALLGALAEGKTVVRGAEELRHKESDRIATVVDGLRNLGVEIEASEDGFEVEGAESLRGGELDSAGDHRLAMLGAVAGIASRDGVDVGGFEAAAVSYPEFLEDLRSLSDGQ
jgi:3-phosphoshikimate 1-carboxyvinyltransferase